jgi:hypothetical protein
MADLNGHEGGNAGNSQGKPTGPDRGGMPSAEGVEGRRQAKGNAGPQNTPRAQDRAGVSSAWDRIGQAARADKERRFTTLLHHVYNIETLREAYFGLKRDAAPGADGETEQTAKRGGRMGNNSKATSRTSPIGCDAERIERSPSGAYSFRSLTDDRGRSGSPRSRTSWSSVPW